MYKSIIFVFASVAVVGCSNIKTTYWDETKIALKAITPYENGRRNGIQKSYSQPGGAGTRAETAYKNGYRHGAYKVFYPNGDLLESWTFRNGNAHGMARTFSKSGNLIGENIYVDGEMVSTKSFYESGALKSTGTGLKRMVYDVTDSKLTSVFGKGHEFQFSELGTLTGQIHHDGMGKNKVIYDATKDIDLREK